MSRSKLESAGYEARRYRKRPNETSNSEVKETMKVSIAAKQAVILFMTMALAVAMVACQGATPKEKTPVVLGGMTLSDMSFSNFVAGTDTAAARTVTLTSSHFRGTNLKYTATSSKPSVATATVSGSTVTVTPKGAGNATVTVIATATADDEEGTQSLSFTVTVTGPEAPPANNPPAVRTIPDEALMVGDTESVTLSRYADDPEGDALTYSASSSNDAVATASVAGDELTITAVAVGMATITVTVSDGTNSPVNREFDVEVTATPPVEPPGPPNERPEQTLIDDIDDMRREGTRELDLSDYYDDPDGDALTYTATPSDEMVATVSVSGSMLTITGVGVGMARITVTASDGTDEVRQTFTVTVGSQAPVVDASLPTSFPLGLAGATKVLNLSKYYDDPEGDALTFAADSSDGTVATVTDPDAMSMITITAVGPGSATITVTASDSDNDPVSLDFFVTVSEPDVDNMGPVVRASMVEDKNLHVGGTETLTLSMYFMDPDAGDTLEYGADSSDDAVATVTDPDAASMITITAVSVGGATITITATDSHGESATATFEVTVTPVPNTPPALTPGMTAPTVTLEDSASWMRDVSGYFMDADGDTLTYTATSSTTNATATIPAGSSMLTITAVAAGTATITVTASDGEDSVDLEIAVTVNPPPNNPPTLTPGRTPPPVSLVLEDDPSEMLDVSRYFMDADGDTLTYSATSSTNNATATIPAGSSMLTITAVTAGPATITVTASDGEASVPLEINVTVDPAPVPQPQNMAPQLNAGMKIGPFTGEPDQLAGGKAIDLDMYFTDPDGSDALLAYKVTQDETKEVPDTAGEEVIHIGGGTAPDACSAIVADGSEETALPDGTNFDSMLWICLKSPGTAEVEIVAIDATDESDPITVKITVLEAGSIMPPVADTVVTTETDDGYNPITDVDGDPDATTRLQIGTPMKVIDNRDIEAYFSDPDFDDDDPDMLTFTVKHFAANTFTVGPITQTVLEGATAITDSTKQQVRASFSQTTWDGDSRDKFTLTLTPQNAGAAVQQIALIATDMYGLSAARVFDVRVNHKPKAEGEQETPLMLSDAEKFDDNTPVLSIPATVGATDHTLTIVEADGGYFSDGDGPADLAGTVGTASTGRYCEASRSFTGDAAPATVSFDRTTNTDEIGLVVSTVAGSVTGSMSISVRCRDAADEWSGTGTLQIRVVDLTGGSIQ